MYTHICIHNLILSPTLHIGMIKDYQTHKKVTQLIHELMSSYSKSRPFQS